MNDDNYYQISGWMINKLKLKGIELNIYAIIYGFSQDGESEFKGSLKYLSEFTGGTSKPTLIKALKDLTEKQFIIRREEIINKVKFNRYRANLPLLKEFDGGGKETLQGGSKETLPNNKLLDNESDNDIKEKISKKEIDAEFESLWKRYPRKKGIESAYKSYLKARQNGTTFDEVINGLENYLKEIEVKKTATQYIKHGSTWFSQHCWQDEYVTVEESKPNEYDDVVNKLNKWLESEE